MHTYLPNGNIDAFDMVALKGSENSSERNESWCVRLFIEMRTQIHFQISILKKSTNFNYRDYLSNGYLNTVSNFNFEKVKKSAFLRTWFDQP